MKEFSIKSSAVLTNFLKPLALLLLVLFLQIRAYASDGDAILGTWMHEDKQSKMLIYKVGKQYFGKVVWLRNPFQNGKPALDSQNENFSLRSKTIMGLVLMANLVFEEKGNNWINGTVYDPNSGKNYACKLTLKDKNTLAMRGYIGKPMFGKTILFVSCD